MEDFWALNEASAFATPSRLVGSVRGGHQLFVFQEGLEPQWELPEMRSGGRWVVSLEVEDARHPNRVSAAPRAESGSDAPPVDREVDRLWETVRLAVTGELLDDAQEVVGCMVEHKAERRPDGRRTPSYRLSVWSRDRDRTDTQRQIGERLRELLGLPRGALEYLSFGKGERNKVLLRA